MNRANPSPPYLNTAGLSAANSVPRSAQHGAAVMLFFACLLPLTALLIALALDIGSLYRVRAQEQAIADAAVLSGAKRLPLRQAAEQTVRTFLTTRSPFLRANPDTPIEFRSPIVEGSPQGSRDSIAVAYTAKVTLPFLGLVMTSPQLDIPVVAKARLNPRDVVIFFDSSRYMAPAPQGDQFLAPEWEDLGEENQGDDPHDDPVGTFSMFYFTSDKNKDYKWPASNFMRRRYPPTPALPNRPHVYTQQCINPVLGAFKEGTIRVYDSLSSVPLNSVGILTGPRADGGVFTIRPVLPGGGSFEGQVENYDFPGTAIRDQHCLAMAEEVMPQLAAWQANEEAQHRSAYDLDWRYPRGGLRYGFPYYPSDLDPRRRYHFQRITTPDGALIPAQLEHLQARMAVWARAVNPNQEVDIRRVLTSIRNAFAAAPLRAAERGALSDISTGTAYLMLGHMPRVVNNAGVTIARFEEQSERALVRQAMRTRLQQINDLAQSQNRTFQIYFMVTRHLAIYPELQCQQSWICERFINDFEALETFLQSVDGNLSHVEIVPVRVPDVGSIAMDFASYMPLFDRATFLSN